ncbi:hypothetical protein MCUN1_000819 [Malassezia cuniculi]|uniref:CP-type G domain-containing protein n=1 Tax=Malassezia cuniculi TaxID=948313 RepID=A0AAF0JA56_9BASI|nr:hypothetical protein MCUN1_000819 [Malassezia cuniculi]
MPLPQSKNRAGLGHAILNRRAKEARERNTSEFHTTDTHVGEPKWTKLRSVTHEGALEEFLNTAQLADADFTAERRNIKVVETAQTSRTRHNPYLLTAQEEAEVIKNQQENRDRLRVPRRPAWDADTTPAQLERLEKDAFLEWRRGLAQLQDGVGLVLTPFERNIEVWRQLWRVIERSQLLVQIVDARNPLRFRCEDLESYVASLPANPADLSVVQDTDYRGPRRTLLLINKSDLLDKEQRKQWADYFSKQGIRFAFFSAADETARQAAKAQRDAQFEAAQNGVEDAAAAVENASLTTRQHAPEDVLNVLELEQLFLDVAPPLEDFSRDGQVPEKLTVGLVGYPNVGKSSTINALLGEKKVSVSATPGKTKHFQTIHLSPTTILCDCPGLVFPQFASTAAELVTDGILPIDQMREYSGPAELVAQRIPHDIIERVYNMDIPTMSVEEGGTGNPTGLEVLSAYAVARNLVRQGQGNPDESRAARYVLKDYMNARLLYAHPPPGVDADEFNAAQRARMRDALPERRAGTGSAQARPAMMHAVESAAGQHRSSAVDSDFFGGVGGTGMMIKGRRRMPPVGRAGSDAGAEQRGGKKHFKGNKRNKQRSGAGFE